MKKGEWKKRTKPFTGDAKESAKTEDTAKTTKAAAKAMPVALSDVVNEALEDTLEIGTKPTKVELTAKELAQRERDCTVKYGSVVPEKLHKQLDQERRANWKSEEETKAMPQWKPTLMPVVLEVLESMPKVVGDFMGTISRPDREVLVSKLANAVQKRLPGRDRDLVEKAVWRALFDLLKDQGVVNRDKIAQI